MNLSKMQHREVSILEKKGIFLRDYCVSLYSSGASTIRIEKSMSRISESWHTKADFSVLPTCMVLTLWDSETDESYNIIGKIPAEAINFATVTKLSALSWRIVDDKLSVDEAIEEYKKILAFKGINPWLVAILASLANGAFCAIFGGDLPSVVIVVVATFFGFVLKQRLPAFGVDYRACIIMAACISALISCTGFVFGIGKTPEVALATSVLYLVPGVPFCNSVCDLIYGHYVCAMSRFMHAMIITVCLSVGLCLAFLILNLQFV